MKEIAERDRDSDLVSRKIITFLWQRIAKHKDDWIDFVKYLWKEKFKKIIGDKISPITLGGDPIDQTLDITIYHTKGRISIHPTEINLIRHKFGLTLIQERRFCT